MVHRYRRCRRKGTTAMTENKKGFLQYGLNCLNCTQIAYLYHCVIHICEINCLKYITYGIMLDNSLCKFVTDIQTNRHGCTTILCFWVKGNIIF